VRWLSKVRKKRVELYLLLDLLDNDTLVKLGYPLSSIYKYRKEWEQAKKDVKELLRSIENNLKQ
jgi:hypothetical protein